MARGRGVVVATSFVIVIVAAACAGGRGVSAPPATRAPTPIAGRSPSTRGGDSTRGTATPAQLLYALGGHAFTVQTIGTVVLVGDTSARVDTVRATTVVRFDGAQIGTGRLRAEAVSSARGARAVGAAVAQPDSAHVGSEILWYVVDSAARNSSSSDFRVADVDHIESCPGPGGSMSGGAGSAAYRTVRDALLPAPRSLVAGASWTDTVTTETCRGDILLTTTAVRRFAVATDAAGLIATVSHSTTAVLHGSAVDGGVDEDVSGEGTGERAARYDIVTGSLLGSDAQQELELTVRSGARTTRLHQSSHTRVTADSTATPD